MRYFWGITNMTEAEQRYKELVRQLHPDVAGGSIREFQDLQAEYRDLPVLLKYLAYLQSFVQTVYVPVPVPQTGVLDVIKEVALKIPTENYISFLTNMFATEDTPKTEE